MKTSMFIAVSTVLLQNIDRIWLRLKEQGFSHIVPDAVRFDRTPWDDMPVSKDGVVVSYETPNEDPTLGKGRYTVEIVPEGIKIMTKWSRSVHAASQTILHYHKHPLYSSVCE